MRLTFIVLVATLLLLAGCQIAAPDNELSGHITLWHRWPPEEAAVLEETLSEFEEIHPEVRITAIALPEERILEEFKQAGNDGLGPGLLLGADGWIGELVETDMLRPLSSDLIADSFFNSRNSSLVQYDDQLFGVPLSVGPRVLYYNKNMVDEPPSTLDELLDEAAAGNRVVFVPRFEEAYWGVQAFGDGLFDDQHRFTLAESGFQEWLTWLDSAQSAPGMILSVDDDSLFELFTTGQVAYYVGGPQKLVELAAIAADEEAEEGFDFGVVPLPDGPNNAAGPLLPAETIMLYAHTSAAQTRLANALAAFLVNPQQSVRFMRELDRAPANPAVWVDRRIYPTVHGFSEQARTSVVIPNEVLTEPLIAAGNRAYVGALSGSLTPEEAVCLFGQEVAEFQGYTTADISMMEGCELLNE